MIPAKDIFHDAFRKDLEKEGWVITDDSLRIRSGRVDMQIDLGAERIVAFPTKEDIVLAFHEPLVRQYTGFAVG
ncbi:fdxN element excision controlling factor protein [Calothrix sp. NIES-2100]|uniref:element excision factor XisH family protein n=1 Tax=Calothrix sp. NIES-2100 TaxID=1954172 RepID=UPI000B5ED643|nr:fdxN element excision controlling factor protein [Calothrix sp. NIES-2100]